MATLSRVYKENPVPQNQIIPLDYSKMNTLPDSHAWWSSSNDDDVNVDDHDHASIPIIDLMDPNAMELIVHACEQWGAFQLVNHGIPSNVIQDVEYQAMTLFSLPSELKLKALRSPNGASGYGRARITPFFPKFMWHEGFTIMGSPSDDVKKIWPNDYVPFCEVMEDYQNRMKVLAEKLTRSMFELLNIREETKKWVGSADATGSIQLNFYPTCPEPNRAMGLAPHTDTTLLTIVHQTHTQTNGLQLLKDGREWIPVRPHPNALVVHTGDYFHIISNARFRSPLHRVTPNASRKRLSVAYFYNPPVDYVMSHVSAAGDHSSVARYRDISVKEYVGIKAKYLEEALSHISITNTNAPN